MDMLSIILDELGDETNKLLKGLWFAVEQLNMDEEKWLEYRQGPHFLV